MSRTFLPHVITDDSALGGSVIERSLRFRGSQYLNRSPSGDGNRRTFTLSVWIKRGDIGEHYILDAFQDDSNRTRIGIEAGNGMQVTNRVGGSTTQLTSSQKLRDFNGWYHLVFAFDTTQATSSNRLKYYLNGVLDTNVSGTYPSQNDVTFVNHSGDNHTIGVGQDSGGLEQYFEGYMAEMHLIDGVQLDASYFGYTDDQTGIWKPKRYTYGNYGTHGFHLEFKDNSSTSTLGKDTSGNGHNFSTNSLNITLGTSDDSMIDTPTNNFPVLNPSNRSSGPTLSFANLYFFYNYKPASKTCRATFRLPKSGKYYWEWENNEASSNPGRWQAGLMNVVNEDSQNGVNYDITGYNDADIISYSYGGSIWFGTTHTSGSWDGTTRSWYRPQRCAWAVDCDTGNVFLGRVADDATTQWWASDGSATGNPSKLLNPTGQIDKDKTHEHLPFISFHEGGSANSTGFAIDVNFGQHAFKGTVPDGFKTLSTANIPPDPTLNSIVRPQRHFDTILYTGDGQNNRKITGLEFKPGLVWLKQRAQSGGGEIDENHGWYDSIRGVTKRLKSNSSAAEDTFPIGSFDDGGFTFTTETYYNSTGSSFVGWFWKAGDATVTNNDGSGTSQVSANQEAGFSIVTYSGNATGGATSAVWQTIGHGLGKTPKWIIFKARNGSESYHAWAVYHHAVTDASTDYVKLNTTDARIQTDVNYMGSTLPTSSVFSLGYNYTTNENGKNYVAYCWCEVPGYSKFGKYTGNGSTDGTFVHLGFRPAWLMVKRTSSTDSWLIMDNKRDTYNPVTQTQAPQSHREDNVNTGGIPTDFLSDGFKCRGSGGDFNGSGQTYIYMAFAEEPGTTPFDTFPNAR